jgi:CheY-like chemotaxis protein
MVLSVLSVFRFLRSASAKNETQKKMKYRCERSHLGYRVSPITEGSMLAKLHILVLEDNMLDAELAIQALDQAGYTCRWECVDTREAFLARLDGHIYDLVISDYNLPMFDGLSAVQLLRQRDPDLPFILVSGTLGEETAIETLKSGATDYVLKHNLSRLAPAVRRALKEAKEQRERREFVEKIREQAALLDLAQDAIVVSNLARRIQFWNKGAERLYGWTARETSGAATSQARSGSSRERLMSAWPGCVRTTPRCFITSLAVAL